ncbi:MAG: DNA primase [Candidatus Fermentibacteraceae bacterium]
MTAGGSGMDDVEAVRQAVDIVDVVGRYVGLKHAGRDYKGLCPFHREKTPSFHVSPDKQVYHCFGCGAGGDVFTFLMRYLGMSFPEALEELAGEAGITLSRGSAPSGRGKALRDITEAAQAFFQRSLEGDGGRGARSYLEGRGIGAEERRTLGLGWAPGGESLCAHLRSKGFSEAQMVEAGMASRSDRGRGVYDRFRRRLTFPIADRRGRPVSFGARTLGEDGPKYLNGPDTPIYSKGSILYGYREAREAARDLDMVVLVEGYFDHARLYLAGIRSVVATCGTALTADQARRMGGISDHVYVCYDGDDSGRRSAVKAAEVMLSQGLNPRIIPLPDGSDPDDFVAAEGAEGFMDLVGRARNPIEFGLDLVGGWEGARESGRGVEVVKRLVEVAGRSADPLVEETLFRSLSESTGYTMDTLRRERDHLEESSRRSPGERPERPPGPSRRDSTLLWAILSCSAEDRGRLLEAVEAADFDTETGRGAFSSLQSQFAQGMERPALAKMDPSQADACAAILSDRAAAAPEDVDRVIARVLRRRMREQRRKLGRRLAEAEGVEKRKILEELSRLSGRLRETDGGDGG